MTIADPLPAAGTALITPHWRRSIRAVRRVLPAASVSVPASTLTDPITAAWVRAQGIAVHARTDDDLELAAATGVRPNRVVLRCGSVTATLREAIGSGVVRFIATTPRHIDILADCATSPSQVYLDEQAPSVFGEHRLQIVGLHADVDTSEGDIEWGCAAERLLCRMALMKTCGLPLLRISLTGGPVRPWREGDATSLRCVASAVDDALEDGCARWRLPRPVVGLAPQTN